MASRQMQLSFFWVSSSTSTTSDSATTQRSVASLTSAFNVEQSSLRNSLCDREPLTKRLCLSCDDDIGLACGQSLDVEAKRKWLDDCFRLQSSDTFPPREQYGSKRKFKYKCLLQYSWLRYSPKENVGFCLPCVLFGKGKDFRGQLVTSSMVNFSQAASPMRRREATPSLTKLISSSILVKVWMTFANSW